MSSPFLSSTNTNQFDKLLGLKEAFESQKKWINTLIRGRFLMQLIPPEIIVDVAKKMKVKSFVGLMKSCKWVNAVLTENRSTFILSSNKVVIDYNKIKDDKLLAENCPYYCFQEMMFCNFENNVDELLAVLKSINGAVAKHVHLVNTLAIKELFLYLQPTHLTVKVSSSSPHFPCPIAAVTRDKIPRYLEYIDVNLDGPSTVELLENVISHFVGKSMSLTIRASLQEMLFDILYDRLEVCMITLSLYRRYQSISFWLTEYRMDNNKLTVMEVFRSKAECSRLMWYRHHGDLYLYLFHNAQPGFVATQLKEMKATQIPIIFVDMEYCSTTCTFREDASLYSNDAFDYRCVDRGNLKNDIKSFHDHDSILEMSFENIEEHKFQSRPKQLEASELQLILDWKQRKSLPQLSWRLPVTDQVEKQLELLQETVDIQGQWITFLKKGKVILKEMPCNCVLEIFKRMDTKAFVKALRTCKEIKKLIDYERPTFIKCVEQGFHIAHCEIEDGMDQWVASELECRSYFRFSEIHFCNFEKETGILQAVASRLAGRKILCDTLQLCRTLLTQQMVESLCPRYINFTNEYYGGPQNYSGHVIKVCVEIMDSSRLISAVEDLAGKRFDVKLILWWYRKSEQDNQLFRQATRCCIEKIKSRRGNRRCVFDCGLIYFCVQDINQEEISRGHDCFSYIKSGKYGQIFIFVAKMAGGVVAGVFSDSETKFLWQFVITMEDFEKLFIDGTGEYDRDLGPEDEIAFSTIRSYFSQ